jgi:hypothetical protein
VVANLRGMQALIDLDEFDSETVKLLIDMYHSRNEDQEESVLSIKQVS